MTTDTKEYTIDHGNGKIEMIEETITTTIQSEKLEKHTNEDEGYGHSIEKGDPNFETVIDSKEIRQIYNDNGELDYIQSNEERALVRRLDFFYVMPCIALMNFFQYFDKSALSYSAVLNIMEDTHISSNQFSWLGSIFYLGYLVFQVPNSYFLQRFPIGRYVGVIIILWGGVLAVTAAGTNFSQLAALRFLLGFFEAGIYPCCLMIISVMYRRREQAGRIGMIYICNGAAMAVGGLIGYGIGHMQGTNGMSGWQWVMIILGSVTVLFGIFCFFLLVDNPTSRAICRTDALKAIVAERIRDNAVAVTREIKVAHMWESVKELRFWCFIFASMFLNMQNGALGTFSTLITSSFGFDRLNSILLTIPSGVADIIYICVAIYVNRRWGWTLPMASLLLVWSTIGLILLITVPYAKAKLLGLYMCWGFAAAYVLLLTSLANNVTGYTKKIFYSSCTIVLYTIGNFAGPLMTMNQPAPYLGGMIGFCVANVIAIILMMLAHLSMLRENRRRLASTTERQFDVLDDLTDVENTNIIYRL
ncbi:major facilitator superfamily domain-containing protein [Halteromyces radiatus]|uniref:major facilitator superfamily domain-containing protein n=1 Tax=Halteromyces radiatus TaxID=101107 RepID=UPI002220A01C|nr:major facilitator superfamily domain-containing protein [Halteromyces radiatus]KAI8099882.1 major facilitator superfamily domain-containing protein [Halteromyces radiatus]